MRLRDVIREAYANAGHLVEERGGGDLFDVIADAIEERYGPLVERVIHYDGSAAVVAAFWIDGSVERGQSIKVPGHVPREARRQMIRMGISGTTHKLIDDQIERGRLPVQHRMGARVLQLPPQWYGGAWVPNRDEPPA